MIKNIIKIYLIFTISINCLNYKNVITRYEGVSQNHLISNNKLSETKYNFQEIDDDEEKVVDLSEGFELYFDEIKEYYNYLLNNNGLYIDDKGLINYIENIDKDYLKPYLDMVIYYLNELMKYEIINIEIVKGKTIISETNKYDDIKKQLENILQNKNEEIEKTENYKNLRPSEEYGKNSIHNCEFKKLDLIELCHNNYTFLVNLYNASRMTQYPFLAVVSLWASRVREEGEWDYKSIDKYGDKTFCAYFNGSHHHIDGEYIGNFHYGYTGSYMFTRDILYEGSFAVARFNKSDYTDWPAIDEGRNEAAIRESKNIRDEMYSISWRSFANTMYKGETTKWYVDVFPYDEEVKWSSSNNKIVKVDEDGNVTACSVGEADIIASIKNKTIRETVKIISPSLSWNETFDTIYEGNTKGWTIKSNPQFDIKWESSNPSVAKVYDNGSIEAISPGKTTITASGNGIKISKELQVLERELKSNTYEINIYEEDKYNWVITTKPKSKIKYSSSNPAVATIDENGTIIGHKAGISTITASANNKNIKVKVTVIKPTITWDKTFKTVYIGQTKKFTVNTKPNNYKVYWSSSDPNIATISNAGLLTPKKTGNVIIVVSNKQKNIAEKYKVNIKNPTIKFTKTNTTIYTGKSTKWEIEKNPTDIKVKWTSSNSNVATVDSNGNIKGIKEGKALIKVSVGDNVICKNIEVKLTPTLSFKNAKNNIYVGEIITWTINKNPSDAKITFSSSDNKIVKVDQNGKITALAKGKAVITIKSGPTTISKEIIIKDKPTLSFKNTNNAIYKYQEVTWTVNKTPSDAKVEWSSTNNKIATVDNNGVIKGVGIGKTDIIAKIGPVSIKKQIIINKPTISWNYTKDTIYKYESTTWTINKNPNNAKITWSTNNIKVAAVDNNGKITGINNGEAIISAKIDEDIIISKKIIIKDPTLSFNKTDDILYIGTSYKWIATTSPNNTITWSSSDTSIVKVNNQGLITPIKKGSAKIIISANGKTRIKNVIVKDNRDIGELFNGD